jgi:acetoin utilization deacetylase AcuC-like enzyme
MKVIVDTIGPQEGGYNHAVLGENVLALIQGMAKKRSC